MATFLNLSPVYGPVMSRRFGVSLGVNLMPASGKICGFDCLYCENGFNADRRTTEGRPTLEDVTDALEAELLDMAANGMSPDVITFAGNGEPTASPIFPQAIDAALELRGRLAPSARVGVLSNGTLAAVPAVHDALMRVDDNILKLDTVDQRFIELLDRPVGAYDVRRQIEAYVAFGGHVTIQTIFLRGSHGGADLDNTGEKFVAPWLAALEEIGPEAATIYTVDRETPAPGLRKAPAEVLDAIAERVRALGIPCTVAY